MLDADIREPLFLYLETRYGKVRIFEEKNIGTSRADVIAITDGELIGLEIKSDGDSYARLKSQIRNYNKYCGKNYLVVGASHRIHAGEHIPDFWGILVVSRDPDTKYNGKSKSFICEKLASGLCLETLLRQLTDEIFERDYTVYN